MLSQFRIFLVYLLIFTHWYGTGSASDRVDLQSNLSVVMPTRSLALPVPYPLSAQTELEQLIGALQAKYDKLTALAADFTQVYHAPGERVRREQGRLLLKKPGRMRWD